MFQSVFARGLFAAKGLVTHKHTPFMLVVAMAIWMGVVFSVIALHRYWQYATWYYDFGIFYDAISS
jgi:uncharacterized membrane protein